MPDVFDSQTQGKGKRWQSWLAIGQKRGRNQKAVRMMHKRPHKKDVAATKARKFHSRYSYVSLRIHEGSDHPCEYLAGEDCESRRLQVFSRDQFKCVDCGTSVGWYTGHLAHGGNTKVSRCWCLENLKTKCYVCHIIIEHNREPKWTPKEAA
jgi:hypothetical protein